MPFLWGEASQRDRADRSRGTASQSYNLSVLSPFLVANQVRLLLLLSPVQGTDLRLSMQRNRRISCQMGNGQAISY